MNLIEIFSSWDKQRDKPKVAPTLDNILKEIYLHGSDQGPWVAGGMGRQLAIGEVDFADIDVWFNNQFQYNELRERLSHTFGYEMYETYSSDNAITYQVGKFKVQLIKRAFYASLDSVFRDFDFTCCQVAVDRDLKVYGPGIEDVRRRVLRLNRLDEKAFLARYAKYVGYGYVMAPDEFIRIIENQKLNYEFDGSVLGY